MTTEPEDGHRARTRADAELADALDSIESIGEDWRSRERAIEDDASAAPDTPPDEKEDDHG